MAKKDKNGAEKLVETTKIGSPQSEAAPESDLTLSGQRDFFATSVEINYLDPSDEIRSPNNVFYAGQDVGLIAMLDNGNPGDYLFTWEFVIANGAEFKEPKPTKLSGEWKWVGRTVSVKTNGVNITVRFSPSNDTGHRNTQKRGRFASVP